MSRWTHIVGAIDIETYIERKDIKEYIEKKMKEAPQITGSEGNASIFVNLEEGYNTSIWIGKCHKEYQTRAIITIQGDLRDKEGEDTRKEVQSFIEYIQNLGWDIENLGININDDCLEGKIMYIN